jgi:hypothetical protein
MKLALATLLEIERSNWSRSDMARAWARCVGRQFLRPGRLVFRTVSEFVIHAGRDTDQVAAAPGNRAGPALINTSAVLDPAFGL